MALKAVKGKREILERIAVDLERLEKEAAEIGEGFLAFLLVNAAHEAKEAEARFGSRAS